MIPHLQSLRLLFMMLIVVSHLSIIGLPEFEAGGDCGVAFFLMLSGYLTMMTRGDALANGTFNHKEYLAVRLKRIYPMYLVALLIAMTLRHSSRELLCALPSLVMIQSWVPFRSIYFGGNPVGWFVSCLFMAWLLLPWIYKVVKLRWVMTALIAVYFLVAYLTPADKVNAWIYAFAPTRLIDFILGMWLYSQRDAFIHKKWFLVGMIWTIVALWDDYGTRAGLRCALIYWGAFWLLIPNAQKINCLNNKMTIWLGNHTLEIYLFHVVILIGIAMLMGLR